MDIFNPETFNSIALPFIMIILLIICGYYDKKTGKIPNRITYPGTMLGIILNTLIYGPNGLISSLISICVIVVLFIIPYFLKQFGAGDVKLLAMIASFMNFYYCIGVTIMSSLICLFYVFYKAFKTKSFKFEIPFGFFMSIGTVIYQGLIYLS